MNAGHFGLLELILYSSEKIRTRGIAITNDSPKKLCKSSAKTLYELLKYILKESKNFLLNKLIL